MARHPAKVITSVTGIAASAASFILQAGDERVMGETTTAMIHNAQGLTMGDHRDHRQHADVLDMLTGTIAQTYAKRSGRKAESFRRLMDSETYFTAEQALEHKLIDRIVPAKGKTNIDPSAFGYNKAEDPEDEGTDIDDDEQAAGVTAVDVQLRLMELEADRG